MLLLIILIVLFLGALVELEKKNRRRGYGRDDASMMIYDGGDGCPDFGGADTGDCGADAGCDGGGGDGGCGE